MYIKGDYGNYMFSAQIFIFRGNAPHQDQVMKFPTANLSFPSSHWWPAHMQVTSETATTHMYLKLLCGQIHIPCLKWYFQVELFHVLLSVSSSIPERKK